jgi:hypothetical protein
MKQRGMLEPHIEMCENVGAEIGTRGTRRCKNKAHSQKI